nr:protein KRI1 [Hymenolepis microstoma]
MRPPTTVASEAFIHRQKIASLRSNFLAQTSNPPKGVPYIGSSTSSTSNIHSFPSEELPSRLLVPITSNESSNNGFLTFPYRLTNSSIQPGSYSPSLPTLNPPSVPRRIARRSGRITSISCNTSSACNQIFDSTISPPLLQPIISEPQMPSYKYTSSPCNHSSYPTIVYETLTSVRGPQAEYSQPVFPNSAMFYHKSVVEPPAVITLSPSEPLCLYTAKRSELCRSCQKQALSRNSSFHRSPSRHSTKRESSEEDSVGTRQRRRLIKPHGSLPTGYRSVNGLKRRSFRRRTLNYSSSSSSGSTSPSINLPEKVDNNHSSDEFWPIAVSQPRNRVCRRRRTKSLNPRARRRKKQFLTMSNSSIDPPADYEDDQEEEARAVDALAMRIQPMLDEGRTAEVQAILLKALTCPEMRQRALSLLDYLTSEGVIFSAQNRQHSQPSRSNEASQADITNTISDVSSDLSQNFASRLQLSGAVDTAGDEDEDETKSSELQGEVRPDSSNVEAGANTTRSNDINNGTIDATPTVSFGRVKVLLPTGGLVEPPPPRLAMPPPKPFPPPTPRAAVVPPPEELARIDEYVLKLLNVNPLLITDLVSQLTRYCKSDVEIVRRLFRWVTTKNFDAVEYDPSAPSDSFIGMLRNVQAGSLSRNELFRELCRFAGIYCQYVSGYSKGAGYRPGMSLKQGALFRNTWLVVFVADGWRFVNCNWAARYATSAWSSLSSGLPDTPPKCDDFYFFTDPEQHIFEHWPDNKVWQLLHAKPVSQARFVSLPVLKSAFFNAGLSLKKPYSQKLVTKNGQVSIKLRMPYFIGISCSLENCADGSFIRGFSLAEVLIKPSDMVRVHCAPSQPGRYYLNIYVSPDWRRDDIRELACSFQVQCCEFNYPRLVVMGRLPEVGFLGRTLAAQHFGVSLLKSTGSGCNGNRPYILHTSSEPLKIPFFISPGLRLCHQLKSFDRPGQQMTDCDNFALLQMRPSSSPSFDSSIASTFTANALPLPYSASSANAHYHLRLPVSAFYYLTIYAAFEETGTITTEASDHLECVYRILVDARRPTVASGSGLVPAFPKQTYWWVGARLLEPTRLNLDVNKRHLFRLDVPVKYVSVAVVINASEWHFLTSNSTSNSNSSTNSVRWSGKVTPTVTGELAVYASTKSGSPVNETSEGVPYVKLLEEMEFKVNEEFAKHYNEYRQKEELMKLKSKYGDIKLKKKSVNDGGDNSEMSDVDSDSSSSSSESDSEWEDQEQEDFLRLYDALCRNDPALNDEEKVWFKEKPEDEGEEEKKAKKMKPVLLKDHVRELLLAEGKDDDLITDPKDSKLDPNAVKEAFLAETAKLFENADDEIFARKTPKPKSDEPKKPPVDTSHFTFDVSQDDAEFLRDYLVNRRWKPAEKKQHQENVAQKSNQSDADKMVEEILAIKKKPAAKLLGLDEPLLTAPEELEEDDNFLVKARRFEDAWNNNEEELEKQYPATTASRYRFEEDDKEFIKTYPRKIDDTLRQPSGKGMTRAEKRKARAERKAAEKAAKMADIKRLKRLKMAEFAERLERIRKSCGDGLALKAKIDMDAENGDDTHMNEVTEEMIDCLDNDWDAEAHDRLIAKLFNDDYYGASTADDALDEAPKVESDEEDAAFLQNIDTGDYEDYLPRQHVCSGNDDGDEGSSKLENKSLKGNADETGTSALARAAKEIYSTLVPRKRGKRARGRSLLRTALDREKPTYDPQKYPKFEEYFNQFYQLDCEDIINGSGPGDDVFCRFKYREVKPNDFGLTVDEILKADEKELNRWVSVKTICAYRTEEEEERDLRKYHSAKMLSKKTKLIPSLLENEDKEGETLSSGEKRVTEVDEGQRISKKALKRLRKKQRKAEFYSAIVAAERDAGEKQLDANIQLDEDKSSAPSGVREKLEELKELANEQESRPTRKRKLEITKVENKDSSVDEVRPEKKKRKQHHQVNRSTKHPKLSDERLKAAGIDLKSYKYMKMTGKM